MEKGQKEVLYGIYGDEEILMDAIRRANKDHLDIMEVFTPFPVHGIDPLLGFAESRLHQAGFVYGATGTCTAFLFMTWVFTRDWPIIFGGKPYWSVPSFIPITFELTVLFAAIGMVVSFYLVCGLGPGVHNEVLDPRLTDDKFCIAFDMGHHTAEEIEKIKSFFAQTGAEEVSIKTI